MAHIFLLNPYLTALLKFHLDALLVEFPGRRTERQQLNS